MNPPIESPRLALRELTYDDVDSLFEIIGDPLTMYAYKSAFDRDQAAMWIEHALASYRDNGWGMWAVVRRADGRFLGDCGPMLQPVEGEAVPELGYHFLRAEWGNGYATEAALACRDWFFAHTDHDRLLSIVSPTNDRSKGVAARVHARMREFHWEKHDMDMCLYETRRADLSGLGMVRSGG